MLLLDDGANRPKVMQAVGLEVLSRSRVPLASYCSLLTASGQTSMMAQPGELLLFLQEAPPAEMMMG
jgi:hypothetical protein